VSGRAARSAPCDVSSVFARNRRPRARRKAEKSSARIVLPGTGQKIFLLPFDVEQPAQPASEDQFALRAPQLVQSHFLCSGLLSCGVFLGGPLSFSIFSSHGATVVNTIETAWGHSDAPKPLDIGCGL